MTLKECRERVAEIEMIRDDDELAHVMEDELHCAVLEAIRDGEADDPGELASAALRTKAIKFGRWYA